ncbi:hypothetical protein KFK09_010834 [Dendrobium nobile]|uniref:Uncharacterized protein n=1 Tax=Dendrobium nobile TaxID=94219 RepID=A0A8T3BCX0_DENNO|nr:hypothetical protein KFK09_010834 [Dendrobium nobile]
MNLVFLINRYLLLLNQTHLKVSFLLLLLYPHQVYLTNLLITLINMFLRLLSLSNQSIPLLQPCNQLLHLNIILLHPLLRIRMSSSHMALPHCSSHPMQTRFKTGNLKPKSIFNLFHQNIPLDPSTYVEEVKEKHWRDAMSQEFQAF